MPVMNGVEAAREFRARVQRRQLKDVPIVALTAYNDEKVSCIQAGMKRFLTKPATVCALTEVFEDLKNGKLN